MVAAAGPGFPRANANPRGAHQPIIWHNFYRKLHENEKKWDGSATGLCVEITLIRLFLQLCQCWQAGLGVFWWKRITF